MKKAILFLLLLGWAAVAQPALVNHIGWYGNPAGTSGPVNMVGANFIAVCTSSVSSGTQIQDSNGNTYSSYEYPTTNGPTLDLYYVSNPVTSANMTFTFGGYVANVDVVGFSGLQSNPYDATAGFQTGSATSATQNTSPITTTVPNELVLACTGANPDGNTYTVVGMNGFTVTDYSTFVSGTNWGGGFAYLVVPTPQSVTPSLEYQTANTVGGTMAAAFKGAAVAATSHTHHTVTGGE